MRKKKGGKSSYTSVTRTRTKGAKGKALFKGAGIRKRKVKDKAL